MNILFSLNKTVKHIHSLPFKVLWPKAMATQFKMNTRRKRRRKKEVQSHRTIQEVLLLSLDYVDLTEEWPQIILDFGSLTGVSLSQWSFCESSETHIHCFFTTIDYWRIPALLGLPSCLPRYVEWGDLKCLGKVALIHRIVTASRIKKRWCTQCPLKRETCSVERGSRWQCFLSRSRSETGLLFFTGEIWPRHTNLCLYPAGHLLCAHKVMDREGTSGSSQELFGWVQDWDAEVCPCVQGLQCPRACKCDYHSTTPSECTEKKDS